MTEPANLPWSQMIDAAADAVVVVAADTTILFANRAVGPVLGYEPAELVGRPYDLLIPERLRSEHLHHHLHYLEAPATRFMGHRPALVACRRDGSEVAVDIALVPLHDDAARVAVFVRDVSNNVRLVERMDATVALFRSALAATTRDELERPGVQLVARVARGTSAWFGRADGDGDAVVVTTGAGPSGGGLVGASLRGLLTTVGATPTVLTRDDLMARVDAARPADVAEPHVLVAAVGSGDAHGLLGVARAEPFEATDVEVTGHFAQAFGIALELTALRERLTDLAVIAEHDRIARDLHDSVIQRLIAMGLRLESLLASPGGNVVERLGETIDELDEVVREVRAAIFNLRRAGRPRGGMRAAVADEVDRFARSLGSSLHLRFEGLVDAVSTPELVREAAVVVREALSNVARHARASHVEVAVEVERGRLAVTVVDNGHGIPADRPHGDGLTNLARRAEDLGGMMRVSTPPGGGTQLEWSVPIVELDSVGEGQ